MIKTIQPLILAAGEGTRMQSSLPKVLHKAAGLPLVEWVMRALAGLGETPIVIYGTGGDALPQYFGHRAKFALQKERLGTGHAVLAAKKELEKSRGEYVLVVAGDMPLLRPASVQRFAQAAVDGAFDLLLLTGKLENPTGYGRILRDADGRVCAIREEKDASETEKAVQEVNISVYCFKKETLLAALPRLTNQNAKGEYYLTDLVAMLYQDGKKTGSMVIDDFAECAGVNNQMELAQAAKVLRRRINETHLANGVQMVDPETTYIDADVQIGRETVVYPGVILEGKTIVGEQCTLFQGSRVQDSVIENGAIVQNSVVLQSHVGKETQVGPYAFLRPGSNIGDGCRIGDFVEIKNSNIGNGTKVSHLTYVGDGDLGKEINIGCGVVFVNYDGKNKFRTTVGDRCFIGCNTNLISPVSVGDGVYIAAGTTVTKDLPDHSFCIGRARETIKAGKANGRFPKKEKP